MNIEQSKRFEIDTSIGNIFDKSTLYTAMWPMEAIVETIQSSGYRGIEWHPLRGFVSSVELNTGLASQESKDAIVSLHQSFRSEKSWKEAFDHPNSAMTMFWYVLLPERVASLNDLEKLQTTLGRKLPIVLYPAHPGEVSGTNRPFSDKLFQPYSAVMQRWNTANVQELITESKSGGYTGFCLDLFHMRAQEVDGLSLNPWQETLPELLSFTKELHISAGRVDIKERHIDTEQELQDLLKGTGNSEIMQILKAIGESGWKGPIVTEIPAAALRNLRASKSPFFSIKNLVEDHRRIVGTIQNLLG